MLNEDVYCPSECFSYRLQGVETYGILATLNAADMVSLVACQVGKVLLGHTLCFAQISDALTYTFAILFLPHNTFPMNHSESSLDTE